MFVLRLQINSELYADQRIIHCCMSKHYNNKQGDFKREWVIWIGNNLILKTNKLFVSSKRNNTINECIEVCSIQGMCISHRHYYAYSYKP